MAGGIIVQDRRYPPSWGESRLLTQWPAAYFIRITIEEAAMIGRRALGLACLCLCAVALSGQTSEDDKDAAANNAASTELFKGHYLAAQEAVAPRAFDSQGKPRASYPYITWSLLHAFITNEPAPSISSEPRPAASAEDAKAIAKARLVDPVAQIVARAKQTRIVILNEDHWVPRDRAFALQVARALRPLGYDVLAAETFTNSPNPKDAEEARTALARDRYPRRWIGYYTHDPVFGDFVRQALHLGYRPVLYEATNLKPVATPYDSVAQRDQGEADIWSPMR
jgi:hypothetical protein